MASLVELSVAPEHRRGHGALYAGVNRGAIDLRRFRAALGGLRLPRLGGRIVLAVDVSPWLRLADLLETFWSAGDLTGLRIRPQAAALPDALPRQLDPPDLDVGERGGPGGQGGLADLLAPADATLTTTTTTTTTERLALGDDPDASG